MSFSMNSWFIIYPGDTKIIKEKYDIMYLNDFGVRIILVTDTLKEAEIKKYTKFIESSLSHEGEIEYAKEAEVRGLVERQGGGDGDNLYIFKEDNIEHERLGDWVL